MKNKDLVKRLSKIIEKEFPKVSVKKKTEILNITLKFLTVLERSDLEEAEKILRKDADFLVSLV